MAVSFLVGASFGSFVSLASYRLPRNMDVVRKPSMCPSCETELKISDLFPLISWILAGGKCRHCHVSIGIRYPLMELALGALFAWLYHAHGLTAEGVLLALFATALMILIVADLETRLLPDEAQLVLLLLGVGYHYVMHTPYVLPVVGLVIGLAVGLGLRLGYRLLKKHDGLGLGDVKFFAIAGLWLGLEGLAPFFMLSGIFGVMTALLWRATGRGHVFPFGPALAVSLALCVLNPQIPSLMLRWMTGWMLP